VAHAQRALKYSEAPEYYDALACAYAEMGNFQQARQTLQQAIKFFPQSDRVNSMKERLELFQKRKPYREDWKPQS
jgi:Flp pilus assembly protein TadD